MSGFFGNKGYGAGGPGARPQIRVGGPLTPAVKVLLIANVIVFAFTFLPSLTPGGSEAVSVITGYLGMTPAIFWSQFTLWMPFTYMFLHGGIFHVLFNMLVLWMFGGDVENVFGTKQFIFYYFFCGVGAGLLVAALQPGMPIPTVGASGAIYAIILAYGLFFPERMIYFWGVIPIKAKYFVFFIGLFVFFSSLSASGDGVSHFAHLGGFIFGIIYIKRRWFGALFRGLGTKNRNKAEVIELDKIRKMFEDDDDSQVH